MGNNENDDNNDLPLESDNTGSQQYGEPPLRSNNISESFKWITPGNYK